MRKRISIWPRRALAAAAAAASLAASLAPVASTQAQEIVLKASLFPPPSNPLVKAMERWAEELKEKSKGRLVIKVFPASQMGPPPRQFDLVRTGVADFAIVLNGATPGRFPLTELIHVPGVGKALYATSLGVSEVAAAVLGPDYPGVKILNVLYTPTVIISRAAIPNAAALKGKRIRAAGSVQSEVFAALGAVPTLVQPGDMNDALSKGMIEGISSGYSGIDSYKLDDAGKFVTEADIGGVTFATLMNLNAYNALPADLRHLIDDSAGMPSARSFGQIFRDEEERLHAGLIKRGIAFSRFTDDGSLKHATERILEQAMKKADGHGGAAKALEQIQSAIARHAAER